MEKKNFRDFLQDEKVHKEANALNMKMPQTVEDVDKVIASIAELAKEKGFETTPEQMVEMKEALIKKVEIENNPQFLREVFKAASAMHQAVFAEGKPDISASGLAHILTMTLSAMDERGIITINTKKLK